MSTTDPTASARRVARERLPFTEVKRLAELFKSSGAMTEWSEGRTAMLLWDDGREIRLEGEDLIEVLYQLRDDYFYQVRDAQEALGQHGIDNEHLSIADSIHLLVGRRGKR